MTTTNAQLYARALRAKNYVGYDKPTKAVDAAANALTFFSKLDGGKTVNSAVVGLTGTYVNPLHPLGEFGRSNLVALFSDDASIIDQTP